MKKLFYHFALAVAAALFLGGCASFKPTDQASLSLAGVESAHSTIFETTIVLTMRVTNESNQPLLIQGSSHKLTLNGSIVGRGVSNAVTEVPALGTATFPVTIQMDNLKLLNRFGRGNVPEGIDYSMDSRLFNRGTSSSGLRVLTEGALDLRPYVNSLMLN